MFDEMLSEITKSIYYSSLPRPHLPSTHSWDEYSGCSQGTIPSWYIFSWVEIFACCESVGISYISCSWSILCYSSSNLLIYFSFGFYIVTNIGSSCIIELPEGIHELLSWITGFSCWIYEIDRIVPDITVWVPLLWISEVCIGSLGSRYFPIHWILRSEPSDPVVIDERNEEREEACLFSYPNEWSLPEKRWWER